MTKRRRITDEDILEMLQKGLLYYRDGHVYKWHGKRKRWTRLTPWIDGQGDGRWRYHLSVKKGNSFRGRTITANKLIWMLVNRRVPEGDVDHINGDCLDNRPENLRDRDQIENRRDNTLIAFRECVDFFNSCLARQHGSQGDF